MTVRSVIRARLGAAVETWKAREVKSPRLFGTGVGIAVLGVPLGLWSVVVAPTGGDRLASIGFVMISVVLAVYSLWASKSVSLGRPRPDDTDGIP